MSAAQRGRKRGPHKPETKAKMSAAAKGKKKSIEHVAAMVASKTGKKYGPRSEVARANLRAAVIRTCAKLSEDDVRQIRRLVAAGETQVEVARRFKIDPSRVTKIKLRKMWAHVTD